VGADKGLGGAVEGAGHARAFSGAPQRPGARNHFRHRWRGVALAGGRSRGRASGPGANHVA
jgi:hypothetical protein